MLLVHTGPLPFVMSLATHRRGVTNDEQDVILSEEYDQRCQCLQVSIQGSLSFPAVRCDAAAPLSLPPFGGTHTCNVDMPTFILPRCIDQGEGCRTAAVRRSCRDASLEPSIRVSDGCATPAATSPAMNTIHHLHPPDSSLGSAPPQVPYSPFSVPSPRSSQLSHPIPIHPLDPRASPYHPHRGA